MGVRYTDGKSQVDSSKKNVTISRRGREIGERDGERKQGERKGDRDRERERDRQSDRETPCQSYCKPLAKKYLKPNRTNYLPRKGFVKSGITCAIM